MNGSPNPWRLISSAVGPAVVGGALTYYVGWRRSNAIANEFGYDTSLLEISVNEFTLRAVAATIGLIPILIVVGFVLSRAGSTFAERIGRATTDSLARSKRRAAWITAAIMLALAAETVWAAFLDGSNRFVFLVVASAAAAIAAWTAGLLFDAATQNIPTRRLPGAVHTVKQSTPAPDRWFVSVATAFALVAIFGAASFAADLDGVSQADRNRAMAEGDHIVTLVSGEPLQLDSPSYAFDGARHYYSGLALMFTEGGRHFLLDPSNTQDVRIVDAAGVGIRLRSDRYPSCRAMSDLQLGSTFGVGETIRTGDSLLTVVALPGVEADRDTSTGFVEVVVTEAGFGLRLVGAAVELFADSAYNSWSIRYDQAATGVMLEHDGTTQLAPTLARAAHDLLIERGLPTRTESLGPDTGGSGVVHWGVDGSEYHLRSAGIGGSDLTIECVDPRDIATPAHD